MWRPWDTETEEEQQLDKSASEGVAVLVSDSDDSVIFVSEHRSPSILWPSRVFRRIKAGALPTFSSSSSLGEYSQFFVLIFLINVCNNILDIITISFVTQYKYELYTFLFYCLILFQLESLPDIILETALSCTDEKTYEDRTVEENIEFM